MGKKRSNVTTPDLEEVSKYTPEEEAKRNSMLANHEAKETKLKNIDAAVQSQIADMDPEEQKAIKEMQAEVNSAIDAENDLLFSDEAFEASQRNAEASRAGRNEPVGKIFTYKGNLLIKT